ncbi:MAG TPA: ATPase, T2SS/T4P/T4SS family [Planctomycetaceae bacterium]|jgi:Flp pilus assembly CpaF family ATPase|nr:ATPase, T2SS/T4P/T4SS family [Planctomycetaceae bacterium]
MRVWYNNVMEAHRYAADVFGSRIRIGRAPSNDIVLNSPFVADEALVLHRQGEQWELQALGLNGCEVNGARVAPGKRFKLLDNTSIQVFPFVLAFESAEQTRTSESQQRQALDRNMFELLHAMHVELLSVMDLGSANDPRVETDEYILSVERNLEEIARLQGLAEPQNAALVAHITGHAVRSRLVEELIHQAGETASATFQPEGTWSRLVSAVPAREDELRRLVAKIMKSLGLDGPGDLSRQMDVVEANFWSSWSAVAEQLFEEFRLYLALRHLKKQIKDIVFGYGPLEDLLRTPTVTEIMVISRDHIYIEKNGIVENSGRQFISDEVTQTIIERIVSKVGRRIDKSQPLVDARLTDGSRVNAVVAPIAVSGPCLTVRKFPLKRLSVDELVRIGSLTDTVAEFLRAAVIARRNILIAGGTGTGKTTLLNCLSDFIPDKERIVTIEDTAELQLHKEHVVRLETKKANAEGAGAYTIHDLVQNALRMRPDRVVVGECRGAEALDMLQAMNTGHDGSMTTLHANSAEDVILRLEVMVQSAADLPIDSIHRQIASAVDLVVQLTRMRDGSRRVTQVTELVGVEDVGGGIRTKDLFLLEQGEQCPRLCPTGRLPSFMGQLIDRNLIRLESFYR